MKPLLSALLIPETEPSVHDIGSLLLFFDSLSYYLPTESGSADTESPGSFKEACTGYAPAPLGGDLKRFNRLLHELVNSRADELARLFSSAKSPVATGEIRDRVETSPGNVLTALHMAKGQEDHIQYKERLWQARLILKLAEVLDAREREVRQGLTRVSSDEQKIYAALAGTDDTDREDHENFSDLKQILRPAGLGINLPAYSSAASALLVNLRLKAWTELFMADSSTDRPFILVAPNPDYGDSILDGYENTWRMIPQKLFSLSLPLIPGLGKSDPENEQYLFQRDNLRQVVLEHLEYFKDLLKKSASLDGDTGLGRHSGHVAAWEETVKIEFPEPATDNRKLDFYCFPDTPPESLLQKIFHIEPLISARKPGYPATILAVVHV